MDMDRERVKKELAKEVPEYVLELITDTKRRRMDWERGGGYLLYQMPLRR